MSDKESGAEVGCPHHYIDKVVSLGGWYNAKKMVVYCQKCGHVSMNEVL